MTFTADKDKIKLDFVKNILINKNLKVHLLAFVAWAGSVWNNVMLHLLNEDYEMWLKASGSGPLSSDFFVACTETGQEWTSLLKEWHYIIRFVFSLCVKTMRYNVLTSEL